MIYNFKIQIKGISKPPVWRKVAIPSDFTFLQFHDVIQIVFGWTDSHLFAFRDVEIRGNLNISISYDELLYDAEMLDASKIKLSDIFTDDFNKMVYVYDFGDYWVHQITLESKSDKKQKYAQCISGKGSCPPEDCGGIYGYEMIKEIFALDPKGSDANSYREWLFLDEDEDWDSNSFCEDEKEDINQELKNS